MSATQSRVTDEINLDEFERRLRAAGAQQAQVEDPLEELSRLVEFSHMGIANGETPAQPAARAKPGTSASVDAAPFGATSSGSAPRPRNGFAVFTPPSPMFGANTTIVPLLAYGAVDSGADSTSCAVGAGATSPFGMARVTIATARGACLLAGRRVTPRAGDARAGLGLEA